MPKNANKKTWLGPDVGYTDLLDAAQQAEIEAEAAAARKYNPLRPSSAGKCANALALQLDEYRNGNKHPTKLITPQTKRIFALGHAIEWNAIKDFKRLPGFSVVYCQQTVHSFEILRDKEVPERLKGSLDWALVSTEHKAFFDAKSRKDRGIPTKGTRRDGSEFLKTMSEWDLEIKRLSALKSVTPISDTAIWVEDLAAFIEEIGHDDTLSSNVKQLNIYCTSDFAKLEGITHGVIYRFNKNTSQHFEVRFKPSEEVLMDVKRKFDLVSLSVDRGEVPVDRTVFKPHDFAADFCDCGWHSPNWSKRDAKDIELLSYSGGFRKKRT